MKNNIFDIEKIKGITIDPIKDPDYVISTDLYDKDFYTYMLFRYWSNNPERKFEVIHYKTLRDKKEFDEEVNNLSKYFNAEILNINEKS